MLDRFAALELLNWGRNAVVSSDISNDEQIRYVISLSHILELSDCKIETSSGAIMVNRKNRKKQIIIYPAMWAEPCSENVVYISDFCIKYAKPYAVQKIIENC